MEGILHKGEFYRGVGGLCTPAFLELLLTHMWLHVMFLEAVKCEVFPAPADAGRRLQRVNTIWVFTRQAGKCAFWSNRWTEDTPGPVSLPFGDNSLDSSVELPLPSSQPVGAQGLICPLTPGVSA